MVPEFDPKSNEKVMLMVSLYYKIAILNETGIILYNYQAFTEANVFS